VKVRPDDRHSDYPSLARARSHLECKASQVLGWQVLHTFALQLWNIAADLPPTVHCGLKDDVVGVQVLPVDLCIGVDQLLRVAHTRNLYEPDQCLNGFTLAEVIAERYLEAKHLMVFVEPVLKQALRHIGRTSIWFDPLGRIAHPPGIYDRTNSRYQQ
jgi:hypothetical protein